MVTFAGLGLVVGVRLRGIERLVGVLGGRQRQFGEQREVIGAEGFHARHAHHTEMLAMEEVIQRPAQQGNVGVEGIEHATAHAGVQQAGQLAEQARGARPGHVVEVAGDDHRLLAVGDAARHLMVDPVALRAHQGFAREFQENAFDRW